METVLAAAGVCVTAALLASLVRRGSPEIAFLLSVAAAAAVLAALGRQGAQAAAFFARLGEESGLPAAVLAPLYKTVGIALVVRLGGGLCRDAGESALAAALETVGAVCALLAAVPLLEEVLTMLWGWMS